MQDGTTSTEFLEWIYVLDKLDEEEFRREDFYLAQIAAEIRRGNSPHPDRIQTKDFLIKFKRLDAQPPAPVDPADSLARSKAFWFALTGVKKG